MPLPVLPLPTIQNWDCHNCGDCCRTYAVRITIEERDRILKQGWMGTPGFGNLEPVVRDKASGEYQLGRTADGACVFLGEDNRCKMHAKFGGASKPFPCRLYPFVLVPHGENWKVSLRYACPSATANLGRTCSVHTDEVIQIAGLIEADSPIPPNAPIPPLQPGAVVPWVDLDRFSKAFLKLLANESVPLERRLRQIAALADQCGKSKFDTVVGARLGEFLKVMSSAVADDVPMESSQVPPPAWVGRTLFRQQAGVFVRQDFGPNAGIGKIGKFARFKAGMDFALGFGVIPALHAKLPKGVPFKDAEQPHGEWPKESNELLVRYFRVKLESGQFFGPANFGRGYWDGLASLLLMYPLTLWAARVMVCGGSKPHQAIQLALRMVDDNFGYSKFLDNSRTAWSLGTLAKKYICYKPPHHHSRESAIIARSGNRWSPGRSRGVPMRRWLLASAVGTLGLLSFAPAEDAKKPESTSELAKARKKFDEALKEKREEMAKAPPGFQKELADELKEFQVIETDKLFEVAESEPTTAEAFGVFSEVLFVALDKEKPKKARDLIAKHHLEQAHIKPLLIKFFQNNDSKIEYALKVDELLKVVALKNPDKDCKGIATLGLAKIAANMIKTSGGETKVEETTKAKRYFEDAKKNFGDVKVGETTVGKLAEAQLKAMQLSDALQVGKKLPDVSGEDLDGKVFKLSEETKGKVVLLNFWATWCPPCMALVPHERELVEKMKDKPFALIGINGDPELDDKVRGIIAEKKITWRSFKNEQKDQPSFAESWGLEGWPTLYVLDHKGVIQHIQKGGGDLDKLDKLIEDLVKAAEGK